MVRLIGGTSVNPMPECESDETLAVNSTNFFLEKINKMRADLDQFEEYEPTMVEIVFELNNFATVSESDKGK